MNEFVGRVLVVLGLVALALFLWRVADVILLIFGASLVAVLLRAIADPIARHTRLPESVAVGVAVALVLGLLVGAGWLFGSEIRKQLQEVLERLPDAWETVTLFLQENALAAAVIESLQDGGPDVGAIAARLTQATATAAGAVVQLIIVVFGGLYLAGNPEVYRDGFLKLFPENGRERVAGVIDSSARALRLWLFGQMITMFAVGTLTALGLWLIGVPAPLALGLIAGLLEFIPYVGPILAAVPGILLALSVGPETALYALVVYVIVQQIESNAIVPLVARQVLQLPPALAVFSVVALGVVFGPLGFVFAAPLTVLLTVAVARLYVRETLGEPAKVLGEPEKGARRTGD
jgi:predicted PurR-regulated permease PerM